MKYEVQQCIALRLRRLSRIADGYLRKELANFDITENQTSILFALDILGEVDQGEIGKRLILERSTVSRGIKLLEKQDYIIKTSSYRPEIRLTKKGIDLVKKIKPIWEKFMNDIFNKIGKDGMMQIENLEKKLL